jgi:RNA polymerase sigma factor (sigma-70 family)
MEYYCRHCHKRDTCTRICEPLAQELRQIYTGQHDLLVAPPNLEVLADRQVITLADLQAVKVELYSRLFPWLIYLEPDQRVSFYLHHFQGLSITRVAKLLRISRWTVRHHLDRARSTLAQEITQATRDMRG